MTPPLRVYPLPHMVSMPTRGTPGSAGLDLYVCWSEDAPVVIRGPYGDSLDALGGADQGGGFGSTGGGL